MSAEGAFWLYDGDAERWRYILVTSLFRRIGPHETFLRLNRALQERLSHHEIKEFDFFVADPDEKIVESVRQAVQTTAFASEPQAAIVILTGEKAPAVVYRMASRLSDRKAKTVQRRFARLYKELVPA
jgi:hypothetical protein